MPIIYDFTKTFQINGKIIKNTPTQTISEDIGCVVNCTIYTQVLDAKYRVTDEDIGCNIILKNTCLLSPGCQKRMDKPLEPKIKIIIYHLIIPDAVIVTTIDSSYLYMPPNIKVRNDLIASKVYPHITEEMDIVKKLHTKI